MLVDPERDLEHDASPELRDRPPRPDQRAALPLAPSSTERHDAPPSPWTTRTGAAFRAMPLAHMVHHAGLVLLHPYLSRFFESTAVKQAGRPELAADQLPRAAALLHLLATGDDDVFEAHIDFIKILLGVPLDAPLLVSRGLLVASDHEEATALLAAVVEHWRVLRSTSIHGLRTSFLQRSGLVRDEDQGFRLQVEPAPFDMLLGHLPWGIATIKLPWMKKLLFTEWQAP